MRRCGAEWDLIPPGRMMLFRYVVRGKEDPLALRVRCRSKKRARFVAALLGGEICQLEKRIHVAGSYVYIKFWGPDSDEPRRVVRVCDEWVPESIARQLAYKWELAGERNQSAWVSWQKYGDGKLLRPHSASDVPF